VTTLAIKARNILTLYQLDLIGEVVKSNHGKLRVQWQEVLNVECRMKKRRTTDWSEKIRTED